MLDAGGLMQWAESAPAGASAVYATGKAPPRTIAAIVASLADQGLVTPHRKRAADGLFQFQLRRSAAPFAVVKPVRVAIACEAEVTLLRIARDAARRGLPFPTNRELAALCGLSDGLAVSYRLRKLVGRGSLSIEDHGPYERRVVTIAGRSTPRATIAGRVIR